MIGISSPERRGNSLTSSGRQRLLTSDSSLEAHRQGDGTVEVDDPDEVIVEPPANTLPRFRFSWRKLAKFMGPGWLMSLAYLDPGNLESDLQQGAYTGYSLVWILWWATVMGLILQELSARLGVVTGRDLAQTIYAEYPAWLRLVIYVMMEIAVIGSDIQEVVGCAIALNLLSSGVIPVWVGCLVTGVDTFTFLAVQYFGVRYLEVLIAVLISVMTGCFFVNWGLAGSDGAALATGWALPLLKSYATTQAVGTIGAVIMPHNLYLHSGLVLSRKIDRQSPTRIHDATWYNFIESGIALLLSFFINLAIVATNADNFFDSKCAQADHGPLACAAGAAEPGMGNISCVLHHGTGGAGVCKEIGLQSEGTALHTALGPAALYVWALGLFAAGQASTMTCTYAGQIIMGGMLQIKLPLAAQVALTRLFALGPALAVATLTIENDQLYNNINEYLNILQSIQLPFAMLPVLHFTASRRLMGRFRSRPLMLAITTTLALLVMAINVYLVIQFFDGMSTAVVACICVYGVFYFGVCVAMVWDDLRRALCCLLGRRAADGDGDDVVVHLRVSGAVGVAPSADDEERAGAAAKATAAAEAGGGASETWLVMMTAKLRAVRRDASGNIDTASYLTAMESIAPVYAMLLSVDMAVKQLQKDINDSCANVRRSYETLPGGAGATLQGIVDYGLANRPRAELVRDPKSVVRGVLWLNRACSFITEFVAQLAAGREGVDAAKNAYVSELKRYHGFLTGAVVSKLMGFAPRRQVIHEKMCPGLTEEEAAAQVRAFLAEMQPLTREIVAFLEEKGANFPETV